MHFRCLKTFEEVQIWADLCKVSFSEKANPPDASHFINHFINDPDSSLEDIFVATSSIDAIEIFVSSIRIFRRVVYDPHASSSKLRAVGIGEVCTIQEYRSRGYSKGLMQHVIKSLTERGYEFFFLHAAEVFRPFYRSFGFVSSEVRWTKINLNSDLRLNSIHVGVNVKLVPITECIDQVSAISNYSNSRFCGPIERTNEYVSKWIANEGMPGGIIGILTETDEEEDRLENQKSESSDMYLHKFQSFACVREFPVGQYQLRDFGTIKSISLESFHHLLWHCIIHLSSTNINNSPTISIPSVIAEELSIPTENSFTTDSGWMWLSVGSEQFDTSKMQLYWPIDNF